MSFIVHNPVFFLAVGLVLEIAALLLRKTRSVWPLHVAAAAWAAAGFWELRIMTVQPEANIRVDLLLIVPVLALLTGWAILQALLRPPKDTRFST